MHQIHLPLKHLLGGQLREHIHQLYQPLVGRTAHNQPPALLALSPAHPRPEHRRHLLLKALLPDDPQPLPLSIGISNEYIGLPRDHTVQVHPIEVVLLVIVIAHQIHAAEHAVADAPAHAAYFAAGLVAHQVDAVVVRVAVQLFRDWGRLVLRRLQVVPFALHRLDGDDVLED